MVVCRRMESRSKGRRVSRRYNWREARKATRDNKLPVPQTDTGRKEEDSKANGRRVVKELGKMSP